MRDSRITGAIDAAQALIRGTAALAVGEAATQLLESMRSAATYRDRSKLAAAQTHLVRTRESLLAAFGQALREKVGADLGEKGQARDDSRAAGPTDWQAVSLVDESQIDERLSFERIGQFISHESEAELRELTAYMSAMLGHGASDPDRNPLRGNIIGSALHQAIEKTSDDTDTQRILAKELGVPMARALPACFRAIVEDLAARGFRKADLAVRATASPAGAVAAGSLLDEARRTWERSMVGRPPGLDAATGDALRSWESSILGRHGHIDPLPDDLDPQSSSALFDRLIRGGLPGSAGRGAAPQANPASAHADAELMSLLRRLNGADTVRDDLRDLPGAPAGNGSGRFAADESVVLRGTGDAQRSGYGELMAANLIRAHRGELMQASQGKLDHLLIEVVSSLFDQILSDSRVAPQMARQIARLQLPVLRVAMRDTSFFSSRRHPVRRFINRISALAAGLSQFDSGPGQNLIARVGALVTEIVEGDFDHVGLYGEKLLELENIVEELATVELESTPAAATLQAKELEWRLQHRFSQRLHVALEPLAIPAFLKTFLAQVWGQVILTATRHDGIDSPADRKFRRTAFDLVVSIQPKRSIEQRAHFLATLPALMATLNLGIALVEWPLAARETFFGQLIAEHAGSLKVAPGTELDHNMMLRQLEAAFRIAVPRSDEPFDEAPAASGADSAVEPHFSADEALSVGLIGEGAVDWSSVFEPVDDGYASMGAEPQAAAAKARAAMPAPAAAAKAVEPLEPGAFPILVDPEEAAVPPALEMAPVEHAATDPDEPTEGPQLRHHLQLGTTYRLHLKDQWEKVRLTYMSPGRTLFLFTHGVRDRSTISMTARMLERLCDSRRLKTYETASLLDRATDRARRQLATLRPTASAPPAA
ncbi:MAG: DUF1631 family protein [Caldimonas sp.]